MADNGFFDFAQTLVGGGQIRDEARLGAQHRLGQIEHLSAQTQKAMEDAKVAQINARKAELEMAAMDQEAEALLTSGFAKNAEDAKALAALRRAGGGNIPQLMQGRGSVQEQGFRGTLADQNATEASRLAASSGIQGKVQATPEGLTSRAQDFRFRELLTPAQQAQFDKLAPDKVMMVAGVPYSRETGQPLVPPEVVAQLLKAGAAARAEGAGLGKRTLDLPQARLRKDNLVAQTNLGTEKIKKLVGNNALWSAVGLGKPLASIPGTEATYIRQQLNSLKSYLKITTLTQLREMSKTGGALGNVSNQDLQTLETAIVSLDDNMAPEDLREQLAILAPYLEGTKDRFEAAFNETYPEALQAPGAAPAVPPQQAPTVKWTRDANGRPIRAQ